MSDGASLERFGEKDIVFIEGVQKTNELLFCSSHFSFLVFGHFLQRSYKNTKILRNLCYILKGKKGMTEKHAKKIMQLK
jgi:hypothetical protein